MQASQEANINASQQTTGGLLNSSQPLPSYLGCYLQNPSTSFPNPLLQASQEATIIALQQATGGLMNSSQPFPWYLGFFKQNPLTSAPNP